MRNPAKQIADAVEYIQAMKGTKDSWFEHAQMLERQCISYGHELAELKSIIKQARANCFSNKPHKTIMGILDKGLKEPL